MKSITELKSSVISVLTRALPEVIFADEFCKRELYSPLEKPLACVYLKQVNSNSAMLKAGGVDIAPAFGQSCEVLLGFSVFCGNEDISPFVIAEQIAHTLLFNEALELADFTCGAASFNTKYRVTELECSAKFNLILEK